MTRTPDGEPADPSRRPPRRWPGSLAGWIGRIRPRGWFLRVRAGPPEPPPRRLLFLDDDPNRADVFLKDHPQAVWVTTVPECLTMLAEPWDEVHLDHDLGGRTFVDSSETDCGMEVIRWLCKEPRPHLKGTSFFVHTHNTAAALLMVLLMRGSGYKAEFRPFGHDLETLLAHNETGSSSGQEAGVCPDPAIGRPGPLRSLRDAVVRKLAVLASIRLRWRFTATGDGPSTSDNRALESGPNADQPGPADLGESSHLLGPAGRIAIPIEPQPAVAESAPAIQPPPRTRSS